MSVSSPTAAASLSWPLCTGTTRPLATTIGFFLCFRLVAVVLAVRLFGAEPQAGVTISLAINYLLLVIVLFADHGVLAHSLREVVHWPCIRPALFFIMLSGISLTWSVTSSMPAAIAFWSAMVADAAIVILLMRDAAPQAAVNAIFRGYIWGACAVALIAWVLPTQSDLRLGDEELLGPNQIGWACAFALSLAYYLMRQNVGRWLFVAIFLGVTLLRTLSKTTILAAVVGCLYVFVRDSGVTRKTKLLVACAAALTVLAFSRLIFDYFDVYTNAGNQAETLTGRIGIWAYILDEALERPWLGHGFHSVWKVIPPFGVFEARHAHNELLQQFYAYGVLGVVVTTTIYTNVLREAHRSSSPALKIFIQGMLLFVCVRGLTDTEVFDLSLPVWFIVIVGALLAHAQSSKGICG